MEDLQNKQGGGAFLKATINPRRIKSIELSSSDNDNENSLPFGINPESMAESTNGSRVQQALNSVANAPEFFKRSFSCHLPMLYIIEGKSINQMIFYRLTCTFIL